MKNLIKPITLLSFATLAIIGCSKVTLDEQETPQSSSEIIKLYAGDGVSANSKVADEGVRTEKGFELGDNIGVTAFYVTGTDATAAPDLTTPADDYITNFLNVKATALTPVLEPVPGSFTNAFSWADNNYQFFPKASKSIFMYAYYPFGDTSAPASVSTRVAGATGVTFVKGDASGTRTLDKLNVVLVNETIADPSTDLPKQADVMVARTVGPVNKASAETATRLLFNHMLSQIKFKIARQSASEKPIYLLNVTLKVPKAATFVIDVPTAELNQYTLTPAAGESYVDSEFATLSVAQANPLELTPSGTDKAGYQDVLTSPFMTFPLSVDELKKCEMTVKINFDGSIGEVTMPVDLSAVSDGFKQGQLNTMFLLVSKQEIALTATIAPWGDAGNNIDIPIE